VARKIVADHLDILHNLSKAVMERETLDSDDIERILKGETLTPGPKGGPSNGGESSGGVSVAA
jgi:cell division protease FtsH